jgi:hypothetical protein
MREQIFLLFFTLFSFDSYAYEIVSETLTVTPGYEGGVLYSKIESGDISHMAKHIHSNSSTEKEFDREETQSDLVEENFD